MSNREPSHSKPEETRLNVLYVAEVLRKYSREDSPLSIQNIVVRINSDYAVYDDAPVISRDTVSRILLSLCTTPEGTFPFSVTECTYSPKEKAYRPHAYWDEKEHKTSTKFYYYSSVFSEAELQVLALSLATHPYFSQEDYKSINGHIRSIHPALFQDEKAYNPSHDLLDDNSLLVMNVDFLTSIIRRRETAVITYCNYDMEKKLVPRDGYPREIEPIAIMWSNGYAYMVAYSEKYASSEGTSYRIDRITEIEKTSRKATHIPEHFDPVKYQFDHPVMYGGSKVSILMLCKNTSSMINLLIDTFGKGVQVTESDRKGWIEARARATASGTAQWAMQHADSVTVLSPQGLRNDIIGRLEQGLGLYQSGLCLQGTIQESAI